MNEPDIAIAVFATIGVVATAVAAFFLPSVIAAVFKTEWMRHREH